MKEKRIVKRVRWFYYFLVKYRGRIYVGKRGPNDIWENLYQFILLEQSQELATGDLDKSKLLRLVLGNVLPQNVTISKIYKQQLTHQSVQGRFIQLSINKPLLLKGYKAVGEKELKKLPFPKFITAYLLENNL